MHRSDPVIDEYTLAAFLAGTLRESRRKEVIDYLAKNADAREVLHMASDALEAAKSPDLAESSPSVLRPAARRRHHREIDRAARKPRSRMNGAGRYVAATVIVFAVGMVLRLAFGPPTDALRSPLQRSTPSLSVDVDVPGPQLRWSSIENAYRYRIVVWDPLAARVVGQYETADSNLGQSHEVVQDLRRKLRQGDPYTLRVDALDAQNRLIRSSETVEFVYQ